MISECCEASPRAEYNGIEFNDLDQGICSSCFENCQYIEESEDE